jgi:adenosylcobinamide-phosphate guanylyltransferase
MIEAVKILDEQCPLFVCVSDIPCITAEIIRTIAEAYDMAGKDACSTWIPARLVESLKCSITYQEQVNGVNACPAGVNILRGDLIASPQEEFRLLLDEPGIALNVNTRNELTIAEDYLKHQSREKQDFKKR